MVLLSNKEKFFNEYKKNLTICRGKFPDEYSWPIEDLDLVFNKMIIAIEKGSFNKNSQTFRMTCKALKIKHTYQEIKKFIES